MSAEIHRKCNILKKKFDCLSVFSSKLKHLQYSYVQFKETIAEIELIMKTHSFEEFGEEYYVVRIEKIILEILTHIFSIRDCLKNKILETNNVSAKYSAEIILSKPLGKQDFDNIDIIMVFSIEAGTRRLYYFNNKSKSIVLLNVSENHIELELNKISNRKELEILLNKYKEYFISQGVMPSKSDNNVNGNLCKKFFDIDAEYQDILSDTLNKAENKTLIKLASELRNKLVHCSLHETKFLTINLSPKYGPHSQIFLTVCDFEHLVLLIKWDTKYYDLSDYYLDEHIQALTYGIIYENGIIFKELLRRISLIPSTASYYVEFEHSKINESSKLIIPFQLKIELEHEYEKNSHVNLYNKLLKHKEYKLFTFLEYVKQVHFAHSDPKMTLTKPKMFFNMQAAINDIYKLYLSYYTQLHDLVSNYFSSEMNYFIQLQREIGMAEDNIKVTMGHYCYKLPENKYSSNKSIG